MTRQGREDTAAIESAAAAAAAREGEGGVERRKEHGNLGETSETELQPKDGGFQDQDSREEQAIFFLPFLSPLKFSESRVQVGWAPGRNRVDTAVVGDDGWEVSARAERLTRD